MERNFLILFCAKISYAYFRLVSVTKLAIVCGNNNKKRNDKRNMPNNKSQQHFTTVNLFIMVQSTRSEITQNKKSSHDCKFGKSGELVYILARDC